MEWMRLDKFLTTQGIGSRREVKELLKKGFILVNDQVEKKPEYKVNLETDDVIFQGKKLSFKQYVYFVLNKPTGCVTATEDRKEKTVLDYITVEKHRNLFILMRKEIRPRHDVLNKYLLWNVGFLVSELICKMHITDWCYGSG